jgi:hypothetical protein
LRFIAFNENFEVAFFTSLINNITTNQPGFTIKNGTAQNDLLVNLKAIQAQEELHALNANNGLKGNKQNPIEPCQYVFPTTNLNDAIALASKFTDIVLATLPDIQTGFATNNDSGLIRGVGSGKQHHFSISRNFKTNLSFSYRPRGRAKWILPPIRQKEQEDPQRPPILDCRYSKLRLFRFEPELRCPELLRRQPHRNYQ